MSKEEAIKNKLIEMQFFSDCHWCMANHKIFEQAKALLRDEPDCSECWYKDSGCKTELGCLLQELKDITMSTPSAGESGGMYPRLGKPKEPENCHGCYKYPILWSKCRKINPNYPKKRCKDYSTEKPDAGKFVKRFCDLIKLSEDHLSNNKIGRLQALGREAIARIEAYEAVLHIEDWNRRGFLGIGEELIKLNRQIGELEGLVKHRTKMLNQADNKIAELQAKLKE